MSEDCVLYFWFDHTRGFARFTGDAPLFFSEEEFLNWPTAVNGITVVSGSIDDWDKQTHFSFAHPSVYPLASATPEQMAEFRTLAAGDARIAYVIIEEQAKTIEDILDIARRVVFADDWATGVKMAHGGNGQFFYWPLEWTAEGSTPLEVAQSG